MAGVEWKQASTRLHCDAARKADTRAIVGACPQHNAES